MSFDINVIIDFSPDVKRAIAAALAGGQLHSENRLYAAVPDPVVRPSDPLGSGPQTEPAVTNGGDSPKPAGRRGRPPRTTSPTPNISAQPEDRQEPAPAEPEPDTNPLAAIGIAADNAALKKLMLLLAAQTDREKAVALMTEYAATAPESFTFTQVSAVPASQLEYMIGSVLDHVDLDAKKQIGLRFLKGEVAADEVMVP